MGNVVIIGAQWGDEGKGKVVDLLCDRVDAVVRFQGGPNAGHTVSVQGQRTFLHHIPAGILHAGRLCLLGNGMVIDPEGLIREIAALEEAGVEVRGRLHVSHRAHLIFPHHRALDAALEGQNGFKIGTTKKGVGLAYQAKVARVGIRPADLDDEEELQQRLKLGLQLHDAWRGVLPALPALSMDDLVKTAAAYREQLSPYVADTVEKLQTAIASGWKVLFEGSQGTLLDVDHGTFPFVTSSNTVVGAACIGAGVGPQQIQDAIGVFKAYCTRVGEGPMPTEEPGEDGETLRRRGNEYGTTTGRPRRCGWFDAVAGRYAARLNGLSLGALTLLDVLDQFDEVKIAIAYDTGARASSQMPATATALSRARPVVETLPGWRADTSRCRTWEDLPEQAQAYVERLESLLGIRFVLISVGPDREQTIVRDPGALDALFG